MRQFHFLVKYLIKYLIDNIQFDLGSDNMKGIYEIALNYLGHEPNTENTKANEEALELLKQIRPYVKYFDSSQYIDDLANGEICLAVGWSGDVFIAAYEEIEEVWYSIPNEGTVIWFDMMGIPADAKNVDNAHKFIDYIKTIILRNMEGCI